MPLPPVEQPGPVFVKVDYTSIWAPHTMIVPLRDAWVDTGLLLGEITPWDSGSNVDVLDMVRDLLVEIADLHIATTTFDAITLYTQPDPELPAQPQASESIAVPGINTSTSWAKATEVILTFRDREFFLSKLTLLDLPTGNDFDPKTRFTVTTEVQDIIDFYVSDDNAFASRKGFQPHQFVRQTAGLNQALRKAYRMT